ncbi:MAG: OmpA family protein [Bacteroidetes bacterium]|nr:OmpA family protein [Bacteroidota bacterium]
MKSIKYKPGFMNLKRTGKKLIILTACIAFTLSTKAQTEDKKWSIGLHGGANQYQGDLGKGFYKGNQALYGFGGISFSRFINRHLDANLLFTKGELGFKGDTSSFQTGFSTVTANVRFNILSSDYVVRPYLFVGAGAMLFAVNPTVTDKSKIDYAAPDFGVGINISLTPTVMLNLQEMVLYSTGDGKDGVNKAGNDAYLQHMVGLTFNFGKKKDADMDGVSDSRDKCANTPPKITVDKTGCPLDKDKDGVADYLDACPDVAGTLALKGCPDKDGDGVGDKEDNCPDEKGTLALNGCPDKDGDDVADKDDRCPDASGSAALKGCPDKDGDGVADLDDKCADTKAGYKVDATGCTKDNDNDGIVNEEDACPDKAGPMVFKGCPDTDGDGVADNDDRCPTIKGTINNKGCPEMAKEDVKKITQIASKIFFEFDSDKLKVASLVQLDELASILKKYEGANLLVGGHTDSDGEDAYNMTLSQKRTESVKTYLMGQGIMESRLTATGFGETQPISDNKTAIGKAKNRRVELKTSY